MFYFSTIGSQKVPGVCSIFSTKGSQKVPGIIWRRRFGAQWVRTALTEFCWSFIRADFVEVMRWSSEEKSRQVAGRDSGFCITITHRATHRLLYSNSSPTVNTRPPQSPDLCPSGFWLFPALKMDPKGTGFTAGTSSRMRWPNSGRFHKKPPAYVSNNGRIDETNVCGRKGPSLEVIRQALPDALPLHCNTAIPGTFDFPLANKVKLSQ
jgi:hypothetical protein